MSPNPSIRPFVLGVLLFLMAIVLWPSRAGVHRQAADAAVAPVAAVH